MQRTIASGTTETSRRPALATQSGGSKTPKKPNNTEKRPSAAAAKPPLIALVRKPAKFVAEMGQCTGITATKMSIFGAGFAEAVTLH